jgi:hypothetical protein
MVRDVGSFVVADDILDGLVIDPAFETVIRITRLYTHRDVSPLSVSISRLSLCHMFAVFGSLRSTFSVNQLMVF